MMSNQQKISSKSAIQAQQLLYIPAPTVDIIETTSGFKTDFPKLFKVLRLIKNMYTVQVQVLYFAKKNYLWVNMKY